MIHSQAGMMPPRDPGDLPQACRQQRRKYGSSSPQMAVEADDDSGLMSDNEVGP